MIVSYDEDLIPTYKLNKMETQELEETGFVQDNELGIVITKIGDMYSVAKITTDYDAILFNKED